MADLWTIDELGGQVALSLATDYDGPADSRVREIPDLRTIRYYTTLGLLDRPAEMRGRTGLYGQRHLLQLVAIKRLQGRGLTLAEIQRQLVGLTDRDLAKLAKVPTNADAKAAATPPAPAAMFWKAAPAEPTPPPAEAIAPLQGVPLDPALTLLLAARRPIEPDDIEAIRIVAAPLLKLLQSRRLIGPPPHERDPS